MKSVEWMIASQFGDRRALKERLRELADTKGLR
jgi:hypothetical protein